MYRIGNYQLEPLQTKKELIFNDVHLVNINFTECIHIHLLGPEFLTASTYQLRWLITP